MYRKLKDNDILTFIEKHKGITIKTCANLFYSHCNNSYYMASRKLKGLYENKRLKRFRKTINDEYVYYISGTPIKPHKTKLLEVYSRLLLNWNVELFEKEIQVENRKNDGLFELVIDRGDYDEIFPLIVEIDYSHDTDFKKMKDIYESGYYQERYEIMPVTLIVKRYDFQKRFSTELFNVVYVNWDLDGIESIFDIK